MVLKTFTVPEQAALFIVLVVCVTLAITAIILRFIATRLAGRKPGLEDWLALAAVILFIPRIAALLTSTIIANGRGITLVEDPDDYTMTLKLAYTGQLLTIPEQSLAKLSICALYYRVFGVHTTYKRWIFGLAALQTAVCIALIFEQAFQCRPAYAFWKPGTPGWCMPATTSLAIFEPPNSIIDFALVILAMVMIRGLNMKTSEKWKLRFLFGLGSLAGVFGFIKIALSFGKDPAYAIASLGLWAAIQSVAGIICCCAPVCKPILPQPGLWSRLASKASSYSLRRTGNNSTTDDATRSQPGLWQRLHPRSSSYSLRRGVKKDMMDEHKQSQEEEWVRLGRPQGGWAVSTDYPEASNPGVNTHSLDSITVHRQVDVV